MRVVVVPAKPFDRAKRRLATHLSPQERAALSRAMLEDVLRACVAQPGWETWVVSRDDDALRTASEVGARPVAEEGLTLLTAVAQAERAANEEGAEEMAVVLGDLPLLTADALAAALSHASAVVAAPASSDGGTNMLLRRPPSAIRARFGRASFAKHRWAAKRAGVAFEEVRSPELAFDLDRPEDLTRLLVEGRTGRTVAAAIDIGLPERLRIGA